MQAPPEEDSGDDEASDSKGIRGWDRVDALAEALLSLSGMAVTTEQARRIRSLYNDLDEYDRRPLSFSPQSSPQKTRGRFGRSKGYRSGHTTIENMKRQAKNAK